MNIGDSSEKGNHLRLVERLHLEETSGSLKSGVPLDDSAREGLLGVRR